MGSLLPESHKLYTYKWHPSNQSDIYEKVTDLSTLPSPLNGKLLIPFTQTHGRQHFIRNHHHRVILINDLQELNPFLFYKFRGLPIVSEEQLALSPECALSLHCKSCPIPLILQRFNQSLLCNYLSAFHVYNLNVQYYDNLQQFLRSQCPISLLICSNIELELLSRRIQNLSYRNPTQGKLTIFCFCNKQTYLFPKKTQLAMQSCKIEVLLFQNLLQIIQKLKKDSLHWPYNIPQKSKKILFFLGQKQKEVKYLSKMARRIQKSLRHLKVYKVANKTQLVQQIRGSGHSIVVIGKDSKEMRDYIDIQQLLEEEGLEDRVIFLRRDAEFNERILQKIKNFTVEPNYVTLALTQKSLVFYGTLQHFKTTLKNFPKLHFKKFISPSHPQSLKSFLSISTEVVVTHLRLCDCIQKWKDQIKCRVILVRSCLGTQKVEKQQAKGCERELWYSTEDEILAAFQGEAVYGVNFNSGNKKMAYLSGIVSQNFTKLKQKKHLLYNDHLGTVFLFSCEYFFFDQITNYILKYFSSKTLGNFDKPCLFQHLKYTLYQQLLHLHKAIGIQEEVITLLQKDESGCVYELADKVAGWVTRYPLLLDEVNNIWELFVYRDRAQYLCNCNFLFFLLLLSYNKTNFVQFHNQTLQHLTLKIKSGLVSCDREGQCAFATRIKGSYVYNISFLVCEQVKPEAVQQPGEIFIRIDGSQLNNFALYLPVWRNESTFIIAPLTKFQLSTKGELLRLKMSLSTQQKLLQRFTQNFLEQRGGLKLFKEEQEMRKLDCFLQNMSNGKLQTAGYILSKLPKQSMANGDLINAYSIFHRLKRGEIDQAYDKLQNDKYFQILSVLIAACREGSTVEAVHSSMNGGQKIRNRSLSNESEQNLPKGSELELRKIATNDFITLPPEIKRNPSEIFSQPFKGKKNSPVSISHSKSKGVAETRAQRRQNSLKIRILPPMPGQFLQRDQCAKLTENLPSSTDKKYVNQIFNCSLTRLNSNSSRSQVFQFLQFDDPIIEYPIDNESTFKRKILPKRQFNLKPSNFVLADNSQHEQQAGTATSTGNFNFQHKEDKSDYFGQVEGMQPVEEELEKHSDSLIEQRAKQIQSDFLKFSKDSNFFQIKRENKLIPRDSIKVPEVGHLLQPLNNIEEESSLINSTQHILASGASLKESLRSQSNKENARYNEEKLFTFYKNDELRYEFGRKSKPHLLSLNNQSLVLSNESPAKCKKSATPSKNQLFYTFQQRQLSSLSSISSMQVDQASVFPQQLVEF